MTSPATPTGTTRQRLLAASLKAFGHRDYDAVSTREIVDAAGANLSSISYHFGGKQQLYLATASHLADSVRRGLAPAMQAIQSTATPADPDTCQRLLAAFIRQLVDDLLQGDLSEDAAGFIFREQNHPTPAFDILFENLIEPIHQTFALLLAGILQCQGQDRELRLITHALMGQIIGFRTGKTAILRHLEKPAYTNTDVKQIADLIVQITLSTLGAVDVSPSPLFLPQTASIKARRTRFGGSK